MENKPRRKWMLKTKIAEMLRFSTKEETSLPPKPESCTEIRDVLCEAQEQREAAGETDIPLMDGCFAVAKGEKVPPIGAVVTGYLYVENELRWCTYELLSLEAAMEIAMIEAQYENDEQDFC